MAGRRSVKRKNSGLQSADKKTSRRRKARSGSGSGNAPAQETAEPAPTQGQAHEIRMTGDVKCKVIYRLWQ